jgi:hypothetical protein
MTMALWQWHFVPMAFWPWHFDTESFWWIREHMLPCKNVIVIDFTTRGLLSSSLSESYKVGIWLPNLKLRSRTEKTISIQFHHKESHHYFSTDLWFHISDLQG